MDAFKKIAKINGVKFNEIMLVLDKKTENKKSQESKENQKKIKKTKEKVADPNIWVHQEAL